MITGSMGGQGAVEFALGVRVMIEGEGHVDTEGYNINIKAKGRVVVLMVKQPTGTQVPASLCKSGSLPRLASRGGSSSLPISTGSRRYTTGSSSSSPVAAPRANVSIDKRIEAVKNGEVDNGLSSLLFLYGRYLLISASLSGLLANQPAGNMEPRPDARLGL